MVISLQNLADLITISENLHDSINIGFKYIDNKSCTLGEAGVNGYKGCIKEAGWRQLLRLTSSTVNIGKTGVHIGSISNEYLARGIFEFDPCHLHYHFQHYQNYLFGSNNLLTGRKTGFCLQTTQRYHNNEWVEFNTPYYYCNYQGLSAGWGDDYFAGLDCQWIDVTHFKTSFYNLNRFYSRFKSR